MLLSGLQNPSTGSIFFKNDNLSIISEEKKTEIRKKNIGLIFQQFYLIPNYTALENVMFPMQINEIRKEKEKLVKFYQISVWQKEKITYLQNYQVGNNKELQLLEQFHLIQKLFLQMNLQEI